MAHRDRKAGEEMAQEEAPYCWTTPASSRYRSTDPDGRYPKESARQAWPEKARRWAAGKKQLIEGVKYTITFAWITGGRISRFVEARDGRDMHRTIEITVPPAHTDTLIHELEQLEHVINLSVVRGASIKPPGDVLTVHVLNRGADQVMSLADAAREKGHVSVTTAELGSIVDPEHERKVAKDIDEALWEEVETGVRHQSRITFNYVTLMVLGGACAAAGLVEEGTSQAISLVAAAIIAPGFEPLAKVPMGLALRRWNVVSTGLRSAGAGYLVLVLSAALAFAALRLAGVATVEDFVDNSQVGELAHPTLDEILVSACGAVAGMTMLLSYRRYLIPGALVALGIIEAAAMTGMALAAGSPALIYEGARRFVLDVLLIVVAGVLLVLLKQATVHRRMPKV